ncbi:Cytochrome P450 [Sesbania bispinosa]|nr:Cytochrome P450 [Sesbania bispinosa]
MVWMIWIAIFVVSLTSLWLWRTSKNAKRLPPGPKGLPILGSLYKLGANPHRDLHKLSQKFGPIMYLRLGFVPTIVVSSPQAAELFLKTHDLVFASRPPHEAAKYISWEQRNLSFGNMKYMDQDLDEKGFKSVMQEGMHLAATPNIGDYIPYIGALDLQGLTKRMKVVHKIFDDFFEKIIDEHMQSENKEDKIKDFVDVMLGFVGTEESEYRIERPNIKAILLVKGITKLIVELFTTNISN